MMNKLGFGTLAAGALLALASISGPVEAREMRDPLLHAVKITPNALGDVAILPAVSVNGDPLAEYRAEAGWLAQYGLGRVRWMSPDVVSQRIAAAGGDELAREVREQIWRNGAVDGPTATRLCRLLGVSAVLSLRVDRWELAERRGMVALTATLNGADGPELWSASGNSGFGRRELPDTDALEHPDHRTCTAYSLLLARWSGPLQASMEQQELLSSVIAVDPRD